MFLALSSSAHGECLSPSAEAGATATTVYRCPDEAQPAAKAPLSDMEKSTTVQRGSADEPWFESTPGKADSAATETPPEQRKADPATVQPEIKAAKEQPAEPTAEQPAEEVEIKAAKAAPDDQVEDNIAPKRKQLKAKAPAKKKYAKKKTKRIKVARTKKAKVKEVVATPTEKITSPPPDDKTILITKKDMSLGARIGNWLGL